MSHLKRYEDLIMWQKSRLLCGKIHQYISKDDFSKDYKLIHQINGSSGSIMDNIAEGFGRGSTNEFIQFLGYSKGSCNETKSQLYRALDRNYISQLEFNECYSLAESISAACQGMINYLNQCTHKGQKFKNRV